MYLFSCCTHRGTGFPSGHRCCVPLHCPARHPRTSPLTSPSVPSALLLSDRVCCRKVKHFLGPLARCFFLEGFRIARKIIPLCKIIIIFRAFFPLLVPSLTDFCRQSGPDTTLGLPQHGRASRKTSGERAIFILLKSLVFKPSFRFVAQDDCKGFYTLTQQESLLLLVLLHADAG